MQIVAINGSPRLKGHTQTLLSAYLDGVQQSGQHRVQEISLAKASFSGCIGCYTCAKDGACLLKDDMQNFYPHLAAADLLVLATPLYFWNMTAKMKAFIDRWFAFHTKPQTFAGKKLVLLMTGEGDTLDDGYAVVEDCIRHIANYLQMEPAGVLWCSTGTTPMAENSAGLAQAHAMGAAL